jgi:hypothetical protein
MIVINGFTPRSMPTIQRSFIRQASLLEGPPTVSAAPVQAPVKVAIILVDHGSRKAEANNMLMGLAQKYKALYNIEIVEAAHMELSEPSIATAFRRCVDQGANKIICHPFFLSRGRHVQQDIPGLLGLGLGLGLRSDLMISYP